MERKERMCAMKRAWLERPETTTRAWVCLIWCSERGWCECEGNREFEVCSLGR